MRIVSTWGLTNLHLGTNNMVRIFSPTKQVHFWVFNQRLSSNKLQILENKEKFHHAHKSLCSPQSIKPRQPCHGSRLAVAHCISQSLSNPLPKARTSAKGKPFSHQFKTLFAFLVFPIVCSQGPDPAAGKEKRMGALKMCF